MAVIMCQMRSIGIGAFWFSEYLHPECKDEALSLMVNHSSNIYLINNKNEGRVDKYFSERYRKMGIDPDKFTKNYIPNLYGFNESKKVFLYGKDFGIFV